MNLRHRTAAAFVGAVTLLACGTSAALADTVYNDLDGSIDPVLETMNLTYDSVNTVGSTGSTMLQMRVDGPAAGDRGGCNVQGAPQYVDITAHSTAPGVVVLTNGPTYRFNLCTDTPTVAVQATGLGEADILFEVTGYRSSGGANVFWPTTPADFHVTVTEGGGTTSTGCDADPAAPAWAAAILQKSGFKSGAKQTTNLISQIAHEMQTMADFNNIHKSSHPYYENAVHDRLEAITGKTLASAALSARPGWICTAIS
jgi:hypothetical protein